ncbi:hypothetical protein DXT99_10395 [Pontibacter diazotrophicus]|uniref:Lipoprotein n=1 Tax=Pontibacter diazotrophicus TaxID=1400979 RepID=A0A3D8LCQ3_9BACT|nr:hypothetical protein [Pontibacter diazotrophicus]RDV15076.1 hypothetical protein DXT99_10395 [Pontibacter diazotrophicus]
MKNIFSKYSAFILPVLGCLALVGCSKDEIPDPVSSTSSGISAVVNGVNWEASSGNYKLGSRTITNGADAFVGTGDTLTIIGVQVQDGDTTAIMLSVKLSADRVGSYRLRGGTSGDGTAYFLDGVSEAALQETKEKYSGGITNGELQITQYDAANYSVSGNFGFSMSATGETTYTVIAGEIENVTF